MDVLNLPDAKDQLEEVARRVIEGHERVAVRVEGGGVLMLIAQDDIILDVLEDEEDGRVADAARNDPNEEFRPADEVLAELGL